jgi:hypothetical protein
MRLTQQTASGLFFLAFGTIFLWLASSLPMGTAADMGVGYTPRMLAIGCMAVGAVLLVFGLAGRGLRERVTLNARALMLTTLMVAGFALLLPWLGLPLTVVACVLPASLAGESYRWRALWLIAILLAALTTVLFAWLLKLQIPILPDLPGLPKLVIA